MLVVGSVVLCALLGTGASSWIKRLTISRAEKGQRSWKPAWVHPVTVIAGSASVGLVSLLPLPAIYLGVLMLSGVVSWWLLCIDFSVHRLPNPLVALLTSLTAAGAVLAYFMDEVSLDGVIQIVGAGVVAYSGFMLLALITKGGLGYGDVKLAGPLGALTAWTGWHVVGQWVVLSFILGACFGVFMVVTRRIAAHESFAFGPWMILGAYGAVALNLFAGV